MTPKLFELRPNRSLLNPDFNGYKLSLEKIPVLKNELDVSVDRLLPNSDQYSLLHAKLFGLHNHLFTDAYNSDTVYFIDKLWNIQKITLNQATGRLDELQKVWQIPQRNERKSGHYNVTIHFTSKDMAIIGDGTGILHIIHTGDRSEVRTWDSLLFSDEVLESGSSFIIQDAVLVQNNNENELHCLLINIERDKDSEKFVTVISWTVFSKSADSKWGQVSLRVLKASGGFYYCALESNCKFIYIASDKPFKFILDSENPIVEKKVDEKEKVTPKIYSWQQSEDDITVRFNVHSRINKEDLSIITNPTTVLVKYKNTVLLQGSLMHPIDSNLTTWRISNDEILEMTILKRETGLIWQELIPGDQNGEQIIDPNLVAEVHERLAHLCSENEVIPAEAGPAFSSQQIEECDFDEDNTAIFERISGENHDVTHRSNLGSHQVLMSVKLSADMPPAMAIRHDVDACLWSPQNENTDSWSLKHDGSLFAFGYVQASKQQRKFSSCSPDLSYSVICESSRHAFIYRQNKAVTSGELRNRRSGSRVGTVAEQQVVSLAEDEILGLSATNEALYLLTENYILALKVQCTESSL